MVLSARHGVCSIKTQLSSCTVTDSLNCCKEQFNHGFDTEMSHYQSIGRNCVCGVIFFLEHVLSFSPKVSYFPANNIRFGWSLPFRK